MVAEKSPIFWLKTKNEASNLEKIDEKPYGF